MTGSPGPRPSRLPRSFFARSSLEVAPDLLGCTVEHAGVTVRITETEAYAGRDDPGSHAFRGETPRTRVMFGPAGFLYVYFTYGMHFCANVVCGQEGRASAVLLRAGEVVHGFDLAARGRDHLMLRDRARGPARLATALGLDGSHTDRDFCRPALRRPTPRAPLDLVVRAPAAPVDPERIRTGPRVGVSGAGGDGVAYAWRFWVAGDPTVSAYRPGRVRSAPS